METRRPYAETGTTTEATSSDSVSAAARDWATVVAGHAETCTSPTELIERLSDDVSEAFASELFAATHRDWPEPRLLARNGQIIDRFAPSTLRTLLETATQSPSAVTLPTSDGKSETRALQIQLLDGGDLKDEGSGAPPARRSSSMLVVYPEHTSPSPVEQIRDLKSLGELAKYCRQALVELERSSKKQESERSVTFTQPHPVSHQALRYLHQDLDLQATAFRAANELRRIAGVDRAAVLLNRRGRFSIQAISGVAVIDRRANAVRAAEQLVRAAVVLGRTVEFPSAEPLPPQISEPLDAYLDVSGVTSMVVVPLFESHKNSPHRDPDSQTAEGSAASAFLEDFVGDREPHAIVLLEQFSGEFDRKQSAQTFEACADVSVALANARQHDRIFGLRTLQLLGDWFGGRRLPYTLLACLVMAVLFVLSMLIKIDHKVIASGVAEPVERRSVFARVDGVVQEILVEDGYDVQKGDPLIRLENADLETSAEDLTGKIQTSTRRLTSIESLLLDPGTDAKQAGRLAIEKRQLESEIKSLRSQLELVQAERKHLIVRAPISGTIEGWQLKRKLGDRPVSRGNELLVVSDTDGEWRLKLEIPDQDAAEVLRYYRDDQSLPVRFAAASHPDVTYSANLQWIASTARRRSDGMNVIDAIASIRLEPGSKRFEAFAISETRTGVEATAKIVCGKRSVLSSWFGDVADFVNRNVLFYVR